MNSICSLRSSLLSFVCFFLVATLAGVFYLLVAYLQNGAFGFPLDDAWIHQVYARNLGARLEFSFFAGQPSAGSTSPLWSIFLSIGYALRVDYRVWTILLGIVFLGASGVMTQRVTKHLTDSARLANWIAPLMVILEWHLVWAAASGMEIVLFVFLSLALVESFFAKRNAFVIGLLAGLLVLTRPDGVLLVALVGIGIVIQNQPLISRISLLSFATFSVALLVLLLPYLFFNLQTSGTLLPNTFYAKSAEYAELTTHTNFFARWISMYRQPLIGAQILLLPGLVYGIYFFARQRAWEKILPALWMVLLPALYAWRLPVEYQFGRYMMPIVPFVMIYGIVGTKLLFEQLEKLPKLSLRVLRRAWGMTIAALLSVFVFLGANFYAQSVAIVNCEMVAVAQWTRANLPHGALVAVHDIGAQGYFDASHPILDLAGLVSPEVIPFIRDEGKLKTWMRERGAQYAVFFPTWYPNLARDETFVEIFSTGCAVTRAMGEENLKVYRLE